MKKKIIGAVFFLLVGGLVQAQQAKELWSQDFEAVKKASAQSGKDILVDFTGSDWCPPCMRMEDEVFTQPAFIQQAPQKFELLRLDYPRKTVQSDKIRQQNERLAQLYPFDSVPTFMLMDKDGKPYAVAIGYLRGGPAAFLKLLDSLGSQKKSLADLNAAADKAPAGPEKAQALHALFHQAEAWELTAFYADLPGKIITQDKDNKAGLKNRYQLLNEYNQLLGTWTEKTDFQQAVADTEKLAQKAVSLPDLQQKILFTEAMIYLNALNDQAKAKEAFQRTISLDKKSPEGQRAAQLLQTLP